MESFHSMLDLWSPTKNALAEAPPLSNDCPKKCSDSRQAQIESARVVDMLTPEK